MQLTSAQFQTAATEVGLTDDQTRRLWEKLNADPGRADAPRFDTAHVAYYLGAMIVIGAMGWLMGNAWEVFEGGGLTLIACGYAVIFCIGGRNFWRNRGLRTPGGLLFTMAVCMTPLALYGLSRWTGFWPAGDPGGYHGFHPRIHASWVFMEIGTVLAGLVALRKYRFAFITAPIAFALWFLSMDLSEWILGQSYRSWEERSFVTMLFGMAILAVAYFTDLRNRGEDFAFWLYLFGLLAFWGGLSSLDSSSELGKAIYCAINLFLIVVSLVLRRRVFVIFGALGFFGYLGHLAHRVFADSVVFPFALTALGLAVIGAGIVYNRHRQTLELIIGNKLTRLCGNFLPARARSA
ncbi:MAG: DUF2157 domain-containing protein [Verrucomicrobia bacterium]|nr:DUF2157 domain-containing protein [Verrucomicrobiota bacterium]